MGICVFTAIIVIFCILLSRLCYATMKEMDKDTYEKYSEDRMGWTLKYWINWMGLTISSMCAFFGSIPIFIEGVKYLINLFRK